LVRTSKGTKEVRDVRRGIEQGPHDRHGGRSVRHRVVQLQQDTDAAVVQAGQEPELPERARPVEQASVDGGGRLQELSIASRGLDGPLLNVVLDGEPSVIDPEGPAAQRSREVHPSSELRNARQTAIQPVPDLLQP
jgi:hypothetical protein